MEGPGPGSGAVGRLLTEDEMAEVKKDVSGGPGRETGATGAGGRGAAGWGRGAGGGSGSAVGGSGRRGAGGLRAPPLRPGIPASHAWRGSAGVAGPALALGSAALGEALGRPIRSWPGAAAALLSSGGAPRGQADSGAQEALPGTGGSSESPVVCCFPEAQRRAGAVSS